MKRLLCILVLICTFLCGCSHPYTPHTADPTKAPAPTQEAIATDRPADTAVPVTAVPTAIITEAPTPAPTEYVPQQRIIASYPILEVLSVFNDGRAWVQFYDDILGWEIAMIDEEGYIRSGLKFTRDSIIQGSSLYVDVNYLGDGYYWIHPYEPGYSRYPGERNVIVHNSGYSILDYRKEGANKKFYFKGYAEGVFTFLLKEADFYSASAHLIDINANGEIINDMELDEQAEDLASKKEVYDYIGNNVFVSDHTGIVYNRNEHTLFETTLCSDQIVFNPDSGCYVLLANSCCYNIAPSDLTNIDAFSNWDADREQHRLLPYAGGYKVSEGIIILETCYSENSEKGLFSLDGELIATFPEGWYIDMIDNFSGGYLAVVAEGADGNDYVAVFDKKGNVQYEPKKIGQFVAPAWHGYVQIKTKGGSYIILSPEGKEVTVDAINAISGDYRIGNLTPFNGGYGVEFKYDDYGRECGFYFLGTDGNIIDTVYYAVYD